MKKFFASRIKKHSGGEEMINQQQQPQGTLEDSIVANGNFDEGLTGWRASHGCHASICDSSTMPGISPHSGGFFAAVTGRTQGWQGIEQDVTGLVKPNVKYEVLAFVRIGGGSRADVLATGRLEKKDCETKFVLLGRTNASKDAWSKLEGTLLLSENFDKVCVYLEGPLPGTDILVDSLRITTQRSAEVPQKQQEQQEKQWADDDGVLHNPNFSRGLAGWTGRSCKLTLDDSHVSSCTGKHLAVASNRLQRWHGIEQDVTGRLMADIMYDVKATVRIRGGDHTNSEVLATLYILKATSQEQYMTIGRTTASTEKWSNLQGNFTIHSMPRRAIIFIEGPAPGVDILVDMFSVLPVKQPEPSPRPHFENPMFGVNIVANFDFQHGVSGWFSLGSCSLHVGDGAPKVLPPSAKASLQCDSHFTGKYVVATNRRFGWEGPAQKLTERIQLFLPYQVSAWVRVGKPGKSCDEHCKVNLALSVDGKWVSGGEVEACSTSWTEVAGSFRLEKKPSEVFVYVQGPEAGVDIMVAYLQIFSVDRSEQNAALKKQTDQVRKRDVVLRVEKSSKIHAPLCLQIKQISSSFALGACIIRNNLENRKYVEFFLENFNYTVFGNETKWGWTEPEQGKLNYRDADELCKFCADHKIPVRGHCVFWEVESCVQSWVQKLDKPELQAAIDKRIASLVSRYRGKFQHYDVNNEMLHGDFYRSRLGPDVHANIFKQIVRLDPSPKLFVNDYHVEDGRDASSCPRRYLQHIEALLSQGAPVGGIGIQGHIDVPVGPVFRRALDELAILGLPIWLTELDVCSSNEHVRADDLEVMLREAFAHPSVEGVILWGFWQGCCRVDGHLVGVDGSLNESGRRLQALREEWRTELCERTDEERKVRFRGFPGRYRAVVEQSDGTSAEAFFYVSADNAAQEVSICLQRK